MPVLRPAEPWSQSLLLPTPGTGEEAVAELDSASHQHACLLGMT